MDINQVITLGIGTPADIPHFVLFGLSPTGPVAVIEAEPIVITVDAEDRVILVDAEDRTVVVYDE